MSIAGSLAVDAAPAVVGQRRRVGDRAPGHVGTGAIDDAALIAAIAAGDAAALDQLYLRYRPVAFAAAYALVRDGHAAEDAVHDAFLNLWRAAVSFRPERGAVRPWLLSIVRNAAIDLIRARQRVYQPRTALACHEMHPSPTDDTFTTVSAAADVRRLRAALGDLPPAQRDAVVLAFLGGLTHGEIAAQTGVPLGTVKGRVRLGLRRLRHDLGDLSLTPRPRRPEGTRPSSRERGRADE